MTSRRNKNIIRTALFMAVIGSGYFRPIALVYMMQYGIDTAKLFEYVTVKSCMEMKGL